MTWVFGYGSLLWRPGFPYREKRPALLRNYHRAFCRLSFRHRGTPEAPGMVVGLRPGGQCRGFAYLLSREPGAEERVLAYLDEREGPGYRRLKLPLELGNGDKSDRGEAWVYLPVPTHPSHAPDLPRSRMVALIATGVGESGTARAYLGDLIAHLAAMDVREPELEEMLRAVEGYGSSQARSPAIPK